MFFYVAQNYRFDSFLIVDANEELILAYRTVKKDVHKVIEQHKRTWPPTDKRLGVTAQPPLL